jgi:hypothetical protein
VTRVDLVLKFAVCVDGVWEMTSRLRHCLPMSSDFWTNAFHTRRVGGHGARIRADALEAQRIGTHPGDHRFRQSMSLAVMMKTTARAN